MFKLVSFKFGDLYLVHQIAKLKTSPKFPAIRYSVLVHTEAAYEYNALILHDYTTSQSYKLLSHARITYYA